MDKLVFIVGAARSGTTMLNRILGLHPNVLALNELHYFGDIWQPDTSTILSKESLISMAEKLLARHYHDFWGGDPGSEEKRRAVEIVSNLAVDEYGGYQLFQAVMEHIAQESSRPIICEQTPRNIFYAKNILAHYPNAYIIHLIRDPRAVLASQKYRWRRKFLGGSDTPWSETIRVWANYHPVTMSKLWSKASATGISMADHPRYMSIKFEEIASSPESAISGICSFLEIEYHQSMLDVPKVGSSNRKNSTNSKGISMESVDAWKLQITPGEVYISEQLTSDNMKAFSYHKFSQGIPLLSIAYYAFLFPIHLLGVVLTNPKRALVQLRAYFNKSL